MEFNRYRRVVLAVMLVLALGFLLLRQWQGPGLPGYRIAPMPLVQTVVATGRIVSVSRAQIGSELASQHQTASQELAWTQSVLAETQAERDQLQQALQQLATAGPDNAALHWKKVS